MDIRECDDSSSDVILDKWKINVVNTDQNVKMNLKLSVIGADPNVLEIFIETDWIAFDGIDVLLD